MTEDYFNKLLDLSASVIETRNKPNQGRKPHPYNPKDDLRTQIACVMSGTGNRQKQINSGWLQSFGRKMLWVVAFASIVSTTLLGINMGLFAGSLTAIGWVLLVPMLMVALYFYYKMYKLDDVHPYAQQTDAYWKKQWDNLFDKSTQPNDNDYRLAMMSILVSFVTIALVLAPNLVLASPYVFVIAVVMIMLMANWVCTRLFPTIAFRMERDHAVLDFAESFWQDLQNENGAFNQLNGLRLKPGAIAQLKKNYTKIEAFCDVMLLLDSMRHDEQRLQGAQAGAQSIELHLYARIKKLTSLEIKSEDESGISNLDTFKGKVAKSVRVKKTARESWAVFFADLFGTINGIVVNPLIMVATTFVGLNALIALLIGSSVQVLPVALVGLPLWAGLLLVLVACAGAYSSTKVTRRSIINGVESVLKAWLQDTPLERGKLLNVIFTTIMTMGMVLLTWLMMANILSAWGIVGLTALALNVFVCLLTTLAVGLLMGKSGIAFMRLLGKAQGDRKKAMRFIGLATLAIVAAGVVASCVMIYGSGMAVTFTAQWAILAMMVTLMLSSFGYHMKAQGAVSANFMIKLSGGVVVAMVASLAVVQFGVMLALPLALTMWLTGFIAICSLPLNFAMFSVLGGVFEDDDAKRQDGKGNAVAASDFSQQGAYANSTWIPAPALLEEKRDHSPELSV